MAIITHQQQLINQKKRDKKYDTHMVKCENCGNKSVLKTKDPLEDNGLCGNVMCNNAGSKKY